MPTKKSDGKTASRKGKATSARAKNTKSSSSPRRKSDSKPTPQSIEIIRQKNQIKAVILFAVSIFLACLFFIEGDNVWLWFHNFMLGLFGGWSIFWSLLFIYVAIVTTLEKPYHSISGKIWLTTIIIILLCTTGFVFSGRFIPDNLGFFGYIQLLYTENVGVGGGLIGGLLGFPMIAAFGESGAKIITLLLLFVSIMILTGATLIGLFRVIKKPVDVVSDGIQKTRTRRIEERQILESSTEIDIPLADKLPDHPVRSENLNNIFPKVEPREKKKTDKSKLHRLEELFGIREVKEEISEKPPAKQQVANTKPNLQESQSLPLNKDEIEEEVEKALEEAFRGFNSKTPVTSAESEPVGFDNQAHNDAKKAAAEFLAKHKEAEQQEIAKLQDILDQKTEEVSIKYIFPPVTMLEEGKKVNPAKESEELQTNGRLLVETLKSFGVQTKILDISRGPSVTRYELQPAAGVKISKITNLADDLAMNLAAIGVRIEAPIPGKAAVGIEVPNKTKNVVRMRELIESNSFMFAKSRLAVALGRDIAGQIQIADLGKMPHMLIAGTTGSGKSVCINSLIVSLLYKSSPDDVRLLMIDPKVVELGIYNGIPHLLVPVVTDPRKAAGALNWAVTEMLKRYKIFADFNVRDLFGYNSLAAANNYEDENGQPMLKMPQIVIIIDELSDLMMAAPNEVEDSICRLAQMARAAGMHLVVATQRPSVDVVTGLIKANIPSRIAFAVSSAIDSRTILDGGGAEKLLGQGDMLFSPVGANKPMRIQGCYVSDNEIESVVEFVKSSHVMEYDEAVIDEIEKNAAAAPTGKNGDSASDNDSEDPMMNEAIKCVVDAGQASTSLLQRRLRLGYARAGRLIDEMEQLGIVGPHEGSKPRQVLMTYPQWLERNMQKPDEDNSGDVRE